MKKLVLLSIVCVILLAGCSTVQHKNIETKWTGLGAKIEYKSTVAISPEDIPKFIKAVDKLEKLLRCSE